MPKALLGHGHKTRGRRAEQRPRLDLSGPTYWEKQDLDTCQGENGAIKQRNRRRPGRRGPGSARQGTETRLVVAVPVVVVVVVLLVVLVIRVEHKWSSLMSR